MIPCIHFSKGDTKTHEKVLNISHEENQIKTTIRYYFTLTKMSIIKKIKKNYW